MTHPAYPPFLRRILARLRKASDACADVYPYFDSHLSSRSTPPPRRATEGEEDLDYAFEWCEIPIVLPDLLHRIHTLIERREHIALGDLAAHADELLAKPSKEPGGDISEQQHTVRALAWPCEPHSAGAWEYTFIDEPNDEVFLMPLHYPKRLFSRYIQAHYDGAHAGNHSVDLVFLPSPPRGTTADP